MRDIDFAAEILSEVQSPVDRAYRYISGLIDLKQVAHGELLPRADVLAKRIGVSRDAVLGALNLLQQHGLVQVGIGRAGVRVAELVGESRDARILWLCEHREVIADMATLRSLVEPGLMRLVAERGLSEPLMAEAQHHHESMCQKAPGSEEAADAGFHRALIAGVGSERIERLSLLARRWVSPAFDLIPWAPNRGAQSNREHAELLEAIATRNPQRAEEIARQHLAASTSRIHQFLENLDIAPPREEHDN